MLCAALPVSNWVTTAFRPLSDALHHLPGNGRTTILNFCHLLERQELTEALFTEVNALLADKGITLRAGTLVYATIIDAPSSTKNKAGARDPEMSSTKKGNDWLSYSPIVGQDLAEIKLLFAPADRVGFHFFSANIPRLVVCRQGPSAAAGGCRRSSISGSQHLPPIPSPRRAGRRIRISASATVAR
jgi:hypothetical protein